MSIWIFQKSRNSPCLFGRSKGSIQLLIPIVKMIPTINGYLRWRKEKKASLKHMGAILGRYLVEQLSIG